MNARPADLLLPYQRAWVDDTSRFKIWLASRQIGKSFAAAYEVVQDCYRHPKARWVVLSTTERQAEEFMEKIHQWTRAFGLGLAGAPPAVCKSSEVRYANGSRVVALPANPNTARGYSAHLVLDEFAFHEDSAAIWRAILPSITNPLRGLLKVRVLSTPNGPQNAFHTLWTNESSKAATASGDGWSRHRTTIYDAVAAGLPVEIEPLRQQFNDPHGWAQEYECQFVDTTSVFLPYELIQQCESPAASEALPAGGSSLTHAYVGIDVGRKQDLTVLWLLDRLGDVLWTRGVLVVERARFHLQLEALAQVLHTHQVVLRKCCVDATGVGAMLAEELARRFGTCRVETCQFTAPFKEELYPRLRRAFEDRLVRIPISCAIREDLHGLRKLCGSTGRLLYQAPHTADGHCDRATALALALRAATEPSPQFVVRPFPSKWGAALAQRQRAA